MSSLSERQIARLRNGHPVQIRHEQIAGTGISYRALHPVMADKVRRAHQAGKGVRLQLSPEDMEAQDQAGCGFFKKLGKSLSKATKTVSKAVKSGQREVHRGLKKAGVLKIANNMIDQGITAAGTAAGAMMGAPPGSTNIITDQINERTGVGIGRQFNKFAKRTNKQFNSVRKVGKKLGIQKEMKALEKNLQHHGQNLAKRGVKALNREVTDLFTKDPPPQAPMAGQGFAGYRGRGFSANLNGGQIYASNNMTMLSQNRPDIAHPLLPRRPTGYQQF